MAALLELSLNQLRYLANRVVVGLYLLLEGRDLAVEHFFLSTH